MSEQLPDVGAAVSHKIGPLPGWAWALIVIGGAWGVHWWRKNHAATATSTTLQAGVPVSDSGTAAWSPAANLPSSGASTGSVVTTPGQVSPSTNAQWAATAANFLIGTGNYSPSDVQGAFDAYLNGNQVSAQYQAIIDTAVHQFGVPPEGVLPVKAAPVTPVALKDRWVKFLVFDNPDGSPSQLYGVRADGTSEGVTFGQWAAMGFPLYQRIHAQAGPAPQAPAPAPAVRAAAAGHTYTVQAGDTAVSIVQRFYGTADTSKLAGQDIAPGHVITIP